MDRKLSSVILALLGTLVFFLLIIWIGGMINESLKLDQTAVLRFVFVIIGMLGVFVVYWVTRSSQNFARANSICSRFSHNLIYTS